MRMIQLLSVACITCIFTTLAPMHAATVKREKLYTKVEHLPKRPLIRVEMMTDAEGAMIEVKGAHNIYDPRTGKKLESAYAGSSYYMYPTAEGLKWGQEFPGMFQLLLVPDLASTSIFLAGTQLRGMLSCYQMEGSIGFVNELSIEDFINSIASSEIPQSTHSKEALAALAIILRGDALYQSKHPANKQFWDIKADDCGYKGYAVLRQDISFIDAMKNTDGMVLARFAEGETSSLVEITHFSKENIAKRAAECEQLATQGKDAKEILQEMFPNYRIILIKDLFPAKKKK